MNTETITREELEFCYYKRGSAGGFKTKLIETIFAADYSNRKKLSQIFPELVGIIDRYNHETGYWKDLQTKFENC
jgi:hypothetical protein